MRFSCCLLLLFAGISCFSQSRERLKEKSFNPAAFEEFKIEIKTGKKDKPLEVHYKAAQFIDGRADTSKLGFVLAGANTEYHRVVFPKPAATYMTEKTIPFLSNGSANNGNLTFVLKHLWVSEVIVKATFGKSLLTGPIDYLSFCYLNSDCYSSVNGEYTLLGNIDTVISIKRWMVGAGEDLLKKTLIDLLQTGDSLFVLQTKKNEPISYDALIKKTQADFDLPILKSSQPERGIYMTYADFLNNNPSIKEFNVIKDKKTESLISIGLDDSLLNKAWGYYDGTDLNIHINNNYYRVVRSHNTFEIAGPRKLDKFYGTNDKIINASVATFFSGIAAGGFTLLVMGSTNKIMKELIPYQLNIRDGALY